VAAARRQRASGVVVGEEAALEVWKAMVVQGLEALRVEERCG
jgi:hypothetical protein